MPDPWRKRVELCGGRAVCYLGDCLEILPTLAENSVDAILTDPPYGLEFMGKDWDHGVPGVPFWAAALRVAKPGAMLLAFGGTRTHHRLACGIEDAGWEIRDCIMVGIVQKPCDVPITAPATDAARLWQGWGTALKPAWEPIIVAMKPLDGTFAANAEKWGVAGLNVDGCRVGIDPAVDDMLRTVERKPRVTQTWEEGSGFKNETNSQTGVPQSGRWPANVVHDGSEEVLAGFPQTTSGAMRRPYKYTNSGTSMGTPSGETRQIHGPDSGSASRFFYCAKASRAERGEGNKHPTVKPLALMEWLCRLVSTPTGGLVLDPFMGSCTTGLACMKNGQKFIGIEKDVESFETACERIAKTPVALTGDQAKDAKVKRTAFF